MRLEGVPQSPALFPRAGSMERFWLMANGSRLMAPRRNSASQLESTLNPPNSTPVFHPANAGNSRNSGQFSQPFFFLNSTSRPPGLGLVGLQFRIPAGVYPPWRAFRIGVFRLVSPGFTKQKNVTPVPLLPIRNPQSQIRNRARPSLPASPAPLRELLGIVPANLSQLRL